MKPLFPKKTERQWPTPGPVTKPAEYDPTNDMDNPGFDGFSNQLADYIAEHQDPQDVDTA